jgi:hypothetical protein
VYTKYDGDALGTGDIKYLSMTRSPGNSYPPGDTQRLVMFNAITDVYNSNGSFRKDTIKKGTLPPGGKGETKPPSLSARSVLDAPYPIDVRMARGRGPGRQGFVPPEPEK